MSALLLSCSVKKESKEVVTPKPKADKTQEILDNMYSSINGFECDLQDDDSTDISKVFYIDRTSTREDGKLYHKFYTIEESSDKAEMGMKMGDVSAWMVAYSEPSDEIYKSSTPVGKKEKDENFYVAKFSFDNKVNSFSYKIVREEMEGTSFVEKETLNSGQIINCVEASYKIMKGLD
jgi:hypothetical protein